jgi:hypothetical protein
VQKKSYVEIAMVDRALRCLKLVTARSQAENEELHGSAMIVTPTESDGKHVLTHHDPSSLLEGTKQYNDNNSLDPTLKPTKVQDKIVNYLLSNIKLNKKAREDCQLFAKLQRYNRHSGSSPLL